MIDFIHQLSIGKDSTIIVYVSFTQIYWAGEMGTSALTALHIAVFSGLRFGSLKWPHKFKNYTEKHAKVLILGLAHLLCKYTSFI